MDIPPLSVTVWKRQTCSKLEPAGPRQTKASYSYFAATPVAIAKEWRLWKAAAGTRGGRG
jgi:hypothetical protein